MQPRQLFLPSILIILCAASTLAQGSSEVLVLGHVTLRLGMSEKETLAELGKDFELRKLDRGWGLLAKGDGKPRQSGFVRFRDGRLIAAGRQWASIDQGKEVDFAKALIAALSSLGAAGKPCSISSLAAQSENDDQSAVITCGDKLLEVTVSHHEILGGATIYEMMGRRR